MEHGYGSTVLRIKRLKWSFVCFFPCQVMRHAGLLRKASHALKEGVSFGSSYVSGKLPTYPSPKPTFCPK